MPVIAESVKTLRARKGGLVRSSRYDGAEVTANGRAAFNRSFERKVDPELVLSPDERARRAEALRRAHFVDLALKSVRSRARNKTTEARSLASVEEVSGGTRTTSATE